MQTSDQQVFQKYYPQAKSYFDSGIAVAAVDITSPNSLSEYQKADSLLKQHNNNFRIIFSGKTGAMPSFHKLMQKYNRQQYSASNSVSDATSTDSQLLCDGKQASLSTMSQVMERQIIILHLQAFSRTGNQRRSSKIQIDGKI